MTRIVQGGSNHNLELVSLWGGGRGGGNMILSVSSNHSQISDSADKETRRQEQERDVLSRGRQCNSDHALAVGAVERRVRGALE